MNTKKGAKNLLNKHGILLTENFDKDLHFKMSCKGGVPSLMV